MSINKEFLDWATNEFGISEDEAREKYGLYTIEEWKKLLDSTKDISWNYYDKEINEYQKGYSEKEIIELLKHIERDERDRRSFYQFDCGTNEKFDFWEMCEKFGLKEKKIVTYELSDEEDI